LVKMLLHRHTSGCFISVDIPVLLESQNVDVADYMTSAGLKENWK